MDRYSTNKALSYLIYRYSNNKVFMSWQLVHGRSFVFARTDWEYVFNTFSFGYAIGYHFIASKEGSCNGNFLGIGKHGTLQLTLYQPTMHIIIIMCHGLSIS